MEHNKIKHWEVWAYDTKPESGHYVDAVIMTINRALDEAHALRQGKKLIKRKYYVLVKVWECDTCNNPTNKTDKLLKEAIIKMLGKENE